MKHLPIKFTPRMKWAAQSGNHPDPAVKHLPEWYKKIAPFEYGDKQVRVINGAVNSTVKRCVPFLDGMSAGYTFYLEEDVNVEVREDGAPFFNWRTERELISFHDKSQFDGLVFPEGYFQQILKWNNPWAVELPKGYSLLCTHPFNRYDLPFLTFTGLVDADSYKLSTHFPFVIKQGWAGMIEAGTPLAQLVPVKRDEWETQVASFDEDEVERTRFKYFSKIDRSYKKQHWSKKTWG